MHQVFVSIGSNIDPEENIEITLSDNEKRIVEKAMPIYEDLNQYSI